MDNTFENWLHYMSIYSYTLEQLLDFKDYFENQLTFEQNKSNFIDYISECSHSFMDLDNEGIYGKEVCRFCGIKQSK